MNHSIETMLAAAEGRYPTRAERSLLTSWASTLEARLAAVQELEASEDRILTETVDEVLRANPELSRREHVRDKTRRDMAIVLRHCAHALIREDVEFLDRTLLVWLRSVLVSLGFDPAFLADSYRRMQRAIVSNVSPRAARLLAPYLDHCITTLGQGARQEAS